MFFRRIYTSLHLLKPVLEYHMAKLFVDLICQKWLEK